MEEIELPTNKIGQGNFGSVFISDDRTKVYKAMTSQNKISSGLVTDWDENAVIQNVTRKTLPFVFEAKYTSLLDHINVSKTFGAFSSNDIYGITTEPLSISLDKILYSGTSKRLNYEQIKSLTCQLFSAVHYLGQVGIVHRDIKPSNMMLNDSGILKLIDFGEVAPVSGFTQETDSGTVFYKPPEFILGSNDYDFKNSFDVWGAGATTLELFLSYPRFSSPGISVGDNSASGQDEGVMKLVMECFPVYERILVTNDGEEVTDTVKEISNSTDYIGGEDVSPEGKFKALMHNRFKRPSDMDDDELNSLVDFLVGSIFVFDRTKRNPKYIDHEYLTKYRKVKGDVSDEKEKISEFTKKVKEFADDVMSANEFGEEPKFPFSYTTKDGKELQPGYDSGGNYVLKVKKKKKWVKYGTHGQEGKDAYYRINDEFVNGFIRLLE